MNCIWSKQGMKSGIKFSHAQYFVENDGGRVAAGFKGSTGDCVTRAIAIVTGKPYKEVYDAINDLSKNKKLGFRKVKTAYGTNYEKVSASRTGVIKEVYREYLFSIGWTWVPTMQVGQGCKVHLRGDELPAGRIIAKVSKHLVAVINGVIHDTYDCSRQGQRCVYGYYINTN